MWIDFDGMLHCCNKRPRRRAAEPAAGAPGQRASAAQITGDQGKREAQRRPPMRAGFEPMPALERPESTIEAEQPLEQPTDDLFGSRHTPSTLKRSGRFEESPWRNHGKSIIDELKVAETPSPIRKWLTSPHFRKRQQGLQYKSGTRSSYPIVYRSAWSHWRQTIYWLSLVIVMFALAWSAGPLMLRSLARLWIVPDGLDHADAIVVLGGGLDAMS
jgi:hypothetical protein